jgi:general stress protein 26
MVKPNNAAKKIIEEIKYLTVATVDENGQPWSTPLAGFHDSEYNFYWASWSENQHSKNIRSNRKVFITIYDSTPPDGPTEGVYIIAEAIELADETEINQSALVFKGDKYNPSDGKYYTGDYPRRIYKAIPKKIWTNSDGNINGNFIDVRVVAEG